MSIMRRMWNLFRRSHLEEEIDAELRSHIEMRTADNISAGMSPEEARRDAVLRFGNRGGLRERVTAADAQMFFDSLGRDLHYTARQLRRSPAFAITAVLTLALGIGANIVAFGVLNALVLRLVDVSQTDRLYNIVQTPHGNDNQSYPDYMDYRTLNSTFSAVAAYRQNIAGLSTGRWATKSLYSEVSANYFDLLGAQPELGQLLHESDDRGPNSAPYIVLSDNFWRAHFNVDSRIVGTTVEIDKHPFTIIGVAQKSFHGPDAWLWPDFWMPMVNEQQIEGWNFLANRFSRVLWVIGKLKRGVTPAQAESNLNAIAAQLAKRYPKTDEGMGARLVAAGLLGDMFGDPARAFLAGIMLLAFLVLLAACANLASLFAARTADRSRELAIRLAIGGSRLHVVRQLLTEAMVVSLLGGAVGTVFATLLLRVLSGWQPFADTQIHVAVAPDARVYGAALLLSIGSGLLFGLLPSRQVWQAGAAQVMKDGSSSVVLFRRLTLRDLLLGLQISLCTLLVTSSLVAFRGMQRALHAPVGFQPQGAILADTDLQMAGYSNDASLPVQRRMLEETTGIPGVTAVGTIDEVPLGAGGSVSPIYRQGTTDFRPTNSVFAAKYFSISPGYLAASGTRLLAGRDFTWHDDADSPKAALVNETFVRGLFNDSSGIGQRFRMPDNSSYEIVGVVEDGKYDSLTENPQPAVFFPLAQNPSSDTTLVVRSHFSAAELAPALSRVLAGIDPNLPFTTQS